jgi:alpha-tubulin suppressor-like RCC1 family protein/DNA-binding beta-propeller fold protein YncE
MRFGIIVSRVSLSGKSFVLLLLCLLAAFSRTAMADPVATTLTCTPNPLAFSVRAGESASLSLQLANPSNGAVDWNLKFLDASGKTNDLEAVVAAINASGSTLNGPLPNRYDFAEGETGSAITTGVPSGTNPIFNQGNKISTNLGGPIPYSNGVVTTSTALGAGGRYFTRKLPGLFLFAADLDGPAWLEVGGTLAYGESRFTSEFSRTLGGKRWSAFVQKITCTYTNTVNHLILIDQSGLSQTTSSYGSEESHRILGLRGKCRVYHLLYITAAKTVQPDSVFEDLAGRLLGIMPEPVSGVLSAAPGAGTTAAAGAATVTATVNASTLSAGIYQAQLAASSPTATLLGSAPVTIEVRPPRLTVPQETIRHITVTGGPVGVVKVPLQSGLDVEQPWSAQILSAPSWLSLAAASGNTPAPLELRFTPGTLTSGSYQSLVRITSGPATFDLGVSMVVDTLTPVRMRADLLRPQLYALHNGSLTGAVVVVSETGVMTKVIATGKTPKDCAFSPDGRFLYTANYSDSTISEIDLDTLEVTRTRPVTLNKGSSGAFIFNLAAGRNGVIYHTDAANLPVVRAMNFASGQLLSTYGPGANEGAGAMWYDNLSQRLYFHTQNYSSGSPTLVALATNGGILSLAGRSAATGATDYSQISSVFASLNRDRLVALSRVHDLSTMTASGPELPSLARAVSAYGHLMAGFSGIIDIATGTSVGSLSGSSGIGDFTWKQDTFVGYNNSTFKFTAWAVPAASRPPSVVLTPNPPANGGLPSDRPVLSWNGQPFVDGYRIYLGTDRAAVENAVPGSAEDRGLTTATSYTLNPPPAPGVVFYWRVEPIRGGTPVQSTVQAAAVAPFTVTPSTYARRLPLGIQPQRVSIAVVDGAGAPVAWSLSESIPWFTPDSTSGTAGTALSGSVSVAGLAAGIQRGTLTVSSGGMSLPVPIEITTYTPNISLLRADPARPYVYGLHTGSTKVAESQLLAIRTSSGAIDMAVDAGTNATDFTIDAAADKLYVANFGKPLLPLVGLSDFSLLPPLAVAADIYGVAADGHGRLVINCGGSNSNRVDLVDANTGTVLGSVAFPWFESPKAGEVHPSGTRYYAGSSSFTSSLYSIDITTNQPGPPVKSDTGYSARPFFNRDGTRMMQGYSAYDAGLRMISYFGNNVRATDSGGRVTICADKLFWTESGMQIGALPLTADLAAVSSDDAYVVLWSNTNKTLTSLRLDTLVTLPGPSPQPGERLPQDSPVAFNWPGSPTATSYQVFLGTAETEVTSAVSGSAWHVATVTLPEWTMPSPPAAGFRYFWRIDTVRGGSTTKGAVWWFDVPLPAAADPVAGPLTTSGNFTFNLGEGGLAAALDNDDTSFLYRIDPTDGHPLPWQQIPLAWNNYYTSPKPAIGQHWTVVGDRNYSTADNSSGGLMLLQPWRDQWQVSQIVLPPSSPDKAWFGSAVTCDGGIFLCGMSGYPSSGKRGRVAAYREWPDFALMQEFQASDGVANDGFGAAITMQGGRALVGATGNSSSRQGRGYIFEFNPATRLWVQKASLLPVTSGVAIPNGSSVALDGDTAVLGATNSIVAESQVHVYTRSSGGTWAKTVSLSEPNGYSYARNNYGASLAVAGDVLFVGASTTPVLGQPAGMVHVFRRSGNTWRIGAPLLPPLGTKGFGSALAVRDGVLYVSSNSQIFTYRISQADNKTPRFNDSPPTQFVAGIVVDREIVATDPDGTVGLSIQAEALPAGLTLSDLGGGRAALRGTPSGGVGATHFLRWRVTDPAGARAWQTAQVTLIDPNDLPELVIAPMTQEAGEGVDVVLRASATGTGPFTWQWRKDGKDLPGANDSALWLHEIRAEQAGIYTVIVRNEAGAVESLPAVITVRSANPYAGDWLTLGNSPAHTGRHPAALESFALLPAWSTVVQSGRSLQRATIADGRAIIVPQTNFNSGHTVKAIGLTSGETQWSFPLPAVFSANPPSVRDGRVYFQLGKGVSDPPSPRLYCLNAATGVEIWASNFDAQWENNEAPAVTDMGVFINGGYYGGMYRFDLDGIQRFYQTMPQISGWTPTVYRDRLFTCVGGTFIEHFPADGGTMWSLANVPGNNMVALQENAAVTLDSTKLTCIDVTNRAIRWQVSGSFRDRPAIGTSHVYAIQGNAVRSYALADGSPGTVYQADGNPSDQPIILNDRLIVAGDTKTWIFRLSDGQLLQTLAAGGRLSYSNRYLLAAGNDGVLRAFIALNTNPKLASLTLSSGAFLPEFDSLKTRYIATVPFDTEAVTITPTTQYPAATVKINGVPEANGSASRRIALNVGENELRTLATAEDGITTMTYTIAVTRLPRDFVFNSAADIPLTANGFATGGFPINIILNYPPVPGTTLTMVNNTGLGFIHGRFSNLAQGQRLWLSHAGGMYPFVANYHGGTGNDLVLQWAGTRVSSWGLNNYGQLGDGGNTQRLKPVAVDHTGVLADKTILAISTGYLHSVALCSDGTLVSWGYNVQGQLGDNSSANKSVPEMVHTSGVLAGRTVVAISSGSYHNLALCSDGTVAAWGYNNHGQLGDGTKTTARVPVLVKTDGILAGKQVVAVAAGAYHSYALCSDGTLAAWGYNDEGELGNDTVTGSTVPVAVDASGSLAGRMVANIAAGQYHALALCTDGTLVSWGYNQRGQLGNSSTADSKSPVAINSFGALSGKIVTAIGAGTSHSLALCADGTLAAWGYNSQSQLGVTGITQITTPVAVPPAKNSTVRTTHSLTVGAHHNLLRFTDGGMAAWGGNTNGQLGSGNTQASAALANVDTSALERGGFIMIAASGRASSHNLAVFAVTLDPPAGLEAWRYENFSPLGAANAVAGDCADCDLDGIPNLVEYAFGLDPNQNSAGQVPRPELVGNRLELRFNGIQLAPDIEYGAEWSPDLSSGSWRDVPDSGTGGEQVFSLPVDSAPHLFMRLRVRERGN